MENGRKLSIGVIGLGQRGSGLTRTLLNCEQAQVVAVCDAYEDRVSDIIKAIEEKSGKKPIGYSDFRDLLNDKSVEAVVISSSWDEHVRMAVAAMKAGKITALEVGGAYDIEACWELVRAYEETNTPFMFLENCCFDKFELLSMSLAKAGKLGEIVHCHGAYSHDLRGEVTGGNVNRHYRLENYRLRNCENYPTHELGPIAKILNINTGNKFMTLSAFASKAAGLSEYVKSDKCPDKSLVDTKFNQGDIISTTIKCLNGETITLTLDTTLPKYYSREFTVRGTKGLCNQEANMVLFDDEKELEEFWEPHLVIKKHLDNADNYREYLPDIWRNITPEEEELGHGGMDYLMLKEFIRCALAGEKMPLDVYDGAAWMSIAALSEQSIACGGAVQCIPDFTRGRFMKRKAKDVTVFPEIVNNGNGDK